MSQPTHLHTHMHIDAGQPLGLIRRQIYGHFAEHLGRCIYEGFWVGEDSPIPNIGGIRRDVVEALRQLKIPVLRWPGGCFADEYHWRDGVGPRESRKRMVNTNWGGVTENNHFGTHEFFALCELLGCEAYVNGNVGSGTVQEMQDWVEYVTSASASSVADERRKNGREDPWPMQYFGVGNENWGCGGNMTAPYYADLYRRYRTFVRDYGDRKIYRVASGSHDGDTAWTDVLMERAAGMMDGLSFHYYTVTDTFQNKGSATGFGEGEWFRLLGHALDMHRLLTAQEEVMDRHDPERRVGLIVDEWGTWFDVEPGTNPGFLYQQNTLRDALVAGVTLNIFNDHAERVHMANLAQTVNVLQSPLLTDGPRLLLTPTYHVLDLYQVHQDARRLAVTLTGAPEYTLEGETLPQLSVSASLGSAGEVNVTVCNLDPNSAAPLRLSLGGLPDWKLLSSRMLTAAEMQAHNTFDAPDTVQLTAGPATTLEGDELQTTLLPMSVTLFTLGR